MTVMAGGNGRVLDPGDDPRRPTARLAKDVWVLGGGRAAPVIVAPPLPQVDLVSSVPTRAADALFWVGRAAERAEAIAKTARVDRVAPPAGPVAGLVRRRPLGAPDGARAARRARRPARRRAAAPAGRSSPSTPSCPAATRAVAERLNALLADAATVGEYLSVTTGRVLGQHGRVARRAERRLRPDRRARRHDRRPGGVRRAVEREHRARPGVALRRHRPAHRAGARRARARRLVPAR